MRLRLIPLILAFPGVLPSVHAATIAQGFLAVPDSIIVRSELTDSEKNATVHFHIVLQMPQEVELKARIQHKERLSRAQLEPYLPPVADYKRVQKWFLDRGFVVALDDSTHAEVFLQGTVEQIGKALHVRFARVTTSDGEATSAVTPPVLPDEIAAGVQSVRGLQPFSRRHHPQQVILSPAGAPVVNFALYADPATIASYYNAPGALTGAGETIAIIGDCIPSTSDLTTFWSVCGIPQSLSSFTVIPVDGGPGNSTVDAYEAALDAEWASGIAVGASIRYYATPYPMYDEDAAYVQILNDLPTVPSLHEVSESYGGIEQLGDSIPAFALLAARGVTCFASSGDSGSNPTPPWAPNPGYYNASYPLAVSYPASDPNITGVGGTTVQLNANGQEVSPETAWSLNQTGNRYATGGGVSQLFSRPSWQTGTGMPSGTTRCVPDVAAIAWSMSNTLTPFIISGNRVVGIGGTSLACPIWAGFCALINQNRISQGLGSIGALNPQIYPLIGTSAFKDVTVGSNGAYTAGVGYDLCTGVGAPSVARLITALSGAAPQITTQPQASQTVLVGGTASFTVVATGIPAPAYQWFFGANAISGATAATYSIASVQAAQAGSYTVTVTNAAGSVTSSPAILVVQQAPQITTQPLASQTVLVGGSASFTVVATGIPAPAYQWFLGANAISGATAATYSLANVQPSQAGSYTVTVTNAAGSVTSSPAVLVVQQAPQITTQPLASQTVLVGGSASFTVVATGIPAPTYQWFLGANAISGATAATYSLANVQASQAGSYTVTVTNAAGSVTSSPAALVVQQAPQITTQPLASQTVLVGGSASFTVVATGIPAPTYQWFLGANAISGATAATYAIASVQASQAGSYTVTVTNSAGSVTSSPAILVVQQAPQITTQPQASQTVLVGGTASFTVVATGIPAPTYQWFFGANAISGATAATYAIASVQASQAGSYTVTVTNAAGSVTSSAAALVVQQAPQITTQPLASQTVLVGGSASFTVVATGIPAPAYQWFFGANAISGATAATYSIASVQAAQAGSYTVTVTNAAGSVTSSAAVLVVQQAPQITTQPLASQTVLVGGTASFTVVATGIPAPTYQWFFGANAISGATAATYSIAGVQAAQAGSYTVTVTNSAGSVTSSSAALVVQQAPQITTQPLASQTVLVGGSASFTVVATGIPAPTYQWFFGANAISGATKATYAIVSVPGSGGVQVAQAGTYTVVVTNVAGSVTSSPATLVVQQRPQITTQPSASQTVLVGGAASFTVVATGIPAPTYQWFFGANAVSGATAATYSLANVQPSQAGSYTVTVTNAAGSVTSSAAVLVVQQAPQITTQPLASQTVLVGGSASFTVVAAGIPAPTYQWFFGANAISGATAATYSIPSVQANQAGSYSVTVTNPAGSITSSAAALVVQQAPQITTQPQASQTILVGGSASFNVVATGIPAPTYQWFLGQNAISGATTATYTLTNVQVAQAGSYSVTVTNAAGNVTSLPAVLVVQQAPQITTQPLASQTVLVDGTASFTVVATGIPAPTYQWFFGANAVSGATAATYTLTNVQAAQAGSYTVTATNAAGSVTSSTAVLVVQQAPQITTQPLASQTVLVGGSASFTVVATGIPAPTYQWFFGANAVSGATAATYTLTNVQAAQAGSYTVTATNAAGSVTSSTAVLVVQQAPQITTQPLASQTVTAGGTASFTVVATGIPAPTYQWLFGANAISGATAATYAIASVQAAQAGSYSVTVTNAAGSVTSSPADSSRPAGPADHNPTAGFPDRACRTARPHSRSSPQASPPRPTSGSLGQTRSLAQRRPRTRSPASKRPKQAATPSQ